MKQTTDIMTDTIISEETALFNRIAHKNAI